MIRPPRLRPGDTIGIASPSWGGGASFPHRVERGVQQLERLGFKVTFAPHALNSIGYVSDTPARRAEDLHTLFSDPQVRAIIASIGGDHSCHLLPLLDFELLRRQPKIFMGFSDITVLNVAIHSTTGLVTFNGPSLMTELADYPQMPEYSERAMLRVLCQAQPAGALEPSSWWTEEFLDWSTQADLRRPRERLPSPGWSWLRGGRAEGRLIGGCLESLQHLRGTRFWPDWSDAILFLETSEEKPSPQTVDGMLMDYENMGVFEQIRGLLFGRPLFYSPEERQALREVILERTSNYRFPIIADMDFGHTSPTLTLPLGCSALIDADRRSFELREAAVS